MAARTAIGIACIALGVGAAVSSALGPLLLGVIDYRTAETGLNQLRGADLATLALVAPAALIADVLWLRGHRLAPVVALAPAAYAAYTFTQAIVGQEYGRYEGNNERFFLLHLALVVLGGALTIRSWAAIDAHALPLPSDRLRRTAAFTLLVAALFLTFGLHLPGLLLVWSGDPPVEAVDAPTAFWVVKFMDLGIVVPLAVAAGTGLLAGSRTALKAAYGLSGAFALLGGSVTAMAVVMEIEGDPASQPLMIPAFGLLSAAFAALAVRLAHASTRAAVAPAPGERTASGAAGDPGPPAG